VNRQDKTVGALAASIFARGSDLARAIRGEVPMSHAQMRWILKEVADLMFEADREGRL
jgi:hypothetical protein